MTMPDSSPERSGVQAENHQDIIPSTERNEDQRRTDESNDLTLGGPRPLTGQERKAADRDLPVREPVFAPASARVPVVPVPGHREFTDRIDTHTAERQGATEMHSHSTQPSHTAYGLDNDANWNNEMRSGPGWLGMGLGWVLLGIGGGVGGWLYLRWRRERNKPINRIRRQAMQAAAELRERVPSSPEEAVRPAAGLTTALISILVILYQQAQARSRQAEKDVSRHTRKAGKRADKAVARATNAVSELDWQQRLSSLKKRWDPSRLELEKISISRH